MNDRDHATELLKPYRARRADAITLFAAQGKCEHCGRQRPLDVYDVGVEWRALCLTCAARHFGALVMQELHLNAIAAR